MDELATEDHPDWWRPVGGSNALDSVLARRSVVSNNGIVPTWQGGSAVVASGKFYPRGMRGWIHEIEMYCWDNAGAGGNIIVNIAPYPGAGILYTGTIVVPAAGLVAWRAALFEVFWNYDSMFIWWYCIAASVEHAYDGELPYDGYFGVILAGAFLPFQRRYWVRVIMYGETPGDVPVSGTLNVVPIPNTISDMDAVTLAINGPGVGNIIDNPLWPAGERILSMGQLTLLSLTLAETLGAVPPANMEIHIVTDAADRMWTVAEIIAALSGVVNTPSPVSMGLVDAVNNIYQVSFSLKFPFRTSLHVYVENTAAAGNNLSVDAIYMYELLA